MSRRAVLPHCCGSAALGELIINAKCLTDLKLLRDGSSSWIGLMVVGAFLAYDMHSVQAQHEWQRPLLPRSRAEVRRIIGPARTEQLTRDCQIVWVWSEHDHDPGYHEYEKVRDLFVGLLSGIPRLRVDTVFKFPRAQQWQTADLVVFYLHFDRLKPSQYETMRSFVHRGGGIIAIHEAMIMRPQGSQLAKCFGLAWDEGRSEWGVMPTPFEIVDQEHPIFAGFGNQMDLVDEFYWKLTGDRNQVRVLATSQAGPPEESRRAPRPEELDGKTWPLFWTNELGDGRVFASLPGHNLYTFNDAYFRIVLLRAMAWTMRESFGPFKPLVTRGVDLSD